MSVSPTSSGCMNGRTQGFPLRQNRDALLLEKKISLTIDTSEMKRVLHQRHSTARSLISSAVLDRARKLFCTSRRNPVVLTTCVHACREVIQNFKHSMAAKKRKAAKRPAKRKAAPKRKAAKRPAKRKA